MEYINFSKSRQYKIMSIFGGPSEFNRSEFNYGLYTLVSGSKFGGTFPYKSGRAYLFSVLYNRDFYARMSGSDVQRNGQETILEIIEQID